MTDRESKLEYLRQYGRAHRAERRIRDAKRVASNRAQGLCDCGSQPKEGCNNCEKCLARALTYHRNHRAAQMLKMKDQKARWKLSGLCLHCGSNKARWGKTTCSDCADNESARRKQRYLANPDATRERMRRQQFSARWRARAAVLAHYGAYCACCGETEEAFLSLDHINGDGAKDRRKIGKAGHAWYLYLVKTGFPTDIQVLCYNCNLAKGFRGVCPHDAMREALLCA